MQYIAMKPEEISQIVKESGDPLDKMVCGVVQCLKVRSWTIASAESCTGGMISEWLTRIPGASDVFEASFCTYSPRMKTAVLGVSKERIEREGVVSAAVAGAMAEGLYERTGADICVSTTGVAGPSGGTAEIPVGTVYVGLRLRDKGYTAHLTLGEDHTREEIREGAARFVFASVHHFLSEGDYAG